jgi:biopolymer transport protein ExbD
MSRFPLGLPIGALAALALSCAASHSPVGSRPETRSPPRDEAAAARTERRAAALQTCRQVFAALARVGGAGAPVIRASDISRSCAGIYEEPACADAMRNPPADPAEFAGAIARPCRDAYCPRLAPPQPALCSRTDLPPPSELLVEWRALNLRILAIELGVPSGALAPTVATVPTNVPSPPPTLPSAEAILRLTISREGDDAVRARIGDGHAVAVGSGANDAFAEMVRHARTASPPEMHLILIVEASLTYRIVATVLDLLHREGFDHVELEVEQAPVSASPGADGGAPAPIRGVK